MNDREKIINYLNEHNNHCVNPSINRMLYGIYQVRNGHLDRDVKKYIKKLTPSKKRRQIRNFVQRIQNEK